MHRIPRARTALLGLAAALALTATAVAQGPPPPKAAGGQTVTTLGNGVPTPTSLAIGDDGTVFAGAAGAEDGSAKGGIYTVRNGEAKLVPGTPPVVFGLAWHDSVLYATSGTKLLAFAGWNGTSFTGGMKTVYSGPKGFPGFNGLAFGPDGRIYAGVTLREKFDNKKDPAPFAQSVVSMKANGKGFRVVARGLRQPFQLAFVAGRRNPFVTVLAQDKGTIPPDFIAQLRQGQNYGFPTCTWTKKAACKRFAKPAILLPQHSSPMGIGVIGKTLYVALFGGIGKSGPEVISVPASGGKPKPFLTGFVAPIVALTTKGNDVYVGDLTGAVYEVPAA